MSRKWKDITTQTKTRKATALTLTALLASCGNDGAQNEVDLQYLINPNSTTQSQIQASWPDKLISKPQRKTIDLSDPKAVAEAMGITLDGSPDQKLYDITIRGSKDESGGRPTDAETVIAVTVANIQEAAAFITSINRALAKEQLSTPAAGR